MTAKLLCMLANGSIEETLWANAADALAADELRPCGSRCVGDHTIVAGDGEGGLTVFSIGGPTRRSEALQARAAYDEQRRLSKQDANTQRRRTEHSQKKSPP